MYSTITYSNFIFYESPNYKFEFLNNEKRNKCKHIFNVYYVLTQPTGFNSDFICKTLTGFARMPLGNSRLQHLLHNFNFSAYKWRLRVFFRTRTRQLKWKPWSRESSAPSDNNYWYLHMSMYRRQRIIYEEEFVAGNKACFTVATGRHGCGNLRSERVTYMPCLQQGYYFELHFSKRLLEKIAIG